MKSSSTYNQYGEKKNVGTLRPRIECPIMKCFDSISRESFFTYLFFILDFIVNRYSRLFSNLCLYCNTSIAIREESAHIIEAMNFISLSSLI